MHRNSILLLLTSLSLAQIVPISINGSTEVPVSEVTSNSGHSISSLTSSQRNQVQYANFQAGSTNYNITISPCAYQLNAVIGNWIFKNGSAGTNVTWLDLNLDAASTRTAEGSLLNSWKNATLVNARALQSEISSYLGPYICNFNSTISLLPGASSDNSVKLRQLQQLVFFPEELGILILSAMAIIPVATFVYQYTAKFIDDQKSLASLDPAKVFETAKLFAVWGMAADILWHLADEEFQGGRQELEVIAGLIARARRILVVIVLDNLVGQAAAAVPGNCFNQDELQQFYQSESTYDDPDVGMTFEQALTQVPNTCPSD